jgi:two-component system, chemotaxis family, chemotaxis protein CheY
LATILIADDVPEVRYTIARSLTKAGHTVIEAEDGAAALEIARRTPLDVIVTDIWMPKIDGVGVLRALRQEFPALRVIAVTGGGRTAPMDFSAALATTWGADRVFTKPFENEDLVREIGILLSEPAPR